MKDLVILFKTNFLINGNLFKIKNDIFLIGNSIKFLFEKIVIKKSVIIDMERISINLLKKYLNLNEYNLDFFLYLSLFKISKIVLTSLQQVFKPCPPTG